MAKSFDIGMAGLIAGLAALTTSYLGIGGTVIGAVIGAILYQVLSLFVKEPLENATIRKVENEIVYIIPLILIAILLGIFIIAIIHSFNFRGSNFLMIFLELEKLTNDNLVRMMGIGLIIMGIYPLFQGKIIKKKYGIINLFLGIFLLIRGLIDINPSFFNFYITHFKIIDLILLIGIFVSLSFIIVKIFSESITLYKGRDKNIEVNEIENSEDNVKSIKSSKTSTMSKYTSFFKKINKK